MFTIQAIAKFTGGPPQTSGMDLLLKTTPIQFIDNGEFSSTCACLKLVFIVPAVLCMQPNEKGKCQPNHIPFIL